MDFSKHLQKADQALKRRNYDYAIELYRQLIDLDPDLGEARSGLRRALVAKHERGSGGKLLRAVSGALPLGRAKALRKMGKLDACARALEDYLLSHPLDEEANLILGTVLEEAGHPHSARAVYEFTAEIAPENPEALKRAGAMLRQAGDPAGAIDYYERALAADPRDREALKARKDLAAETALSRNESEDVLHSRDLVRDREQLARLDRSRRGQLSPEELASERVRLEAELAAGDNPERRAALADVLRLEGDLEGALRELEHALTSRPDSFELVTRAGDLQGKLLKRSLAEADGKGDAQRAASLEAEILAHEVADYGRRSALRPNDPQLRLGLSRRQMRLGELDMAIGELQKIQHDHRVRGEALFHLARCFQRKGIHDLAEKGYRAALQEAEPTGDRAKEILYRLGSIAESRGDAAQARSHYVRIYEIDIGYRDVADKMESL